MDGGRESTEHSLQLQQLQLQLQLVLPCAWQSSQARAQQSHNRITVQVSAHSDWFLAMGFGATEQRSGCSQQWLHL